MTQRKRQPLTIVYAVLSEHGVVPTHFSYNGSLQAFVLSYNQTKGSEFLRLVIDYPMSEKHRKRAELYLRLFPAAKRHTRWRTERMKIYEEWLQLRTDELEERESR